MIPTFPKGARVEYDRQRGAPPVIGTVSSNLEGGGSVILAECILDDHNEIAFLLPRRVAVLVDSRILRPARKILGNTDVGYVLHDLGTSAMSLEHGK